MTIIPGERQTKYISSAIKAREKIVGGQKVFAVKSFFTSDSVDEVGDIITRAATDKAVDKYRKWGNVRFMHQPRPVGKVMKIGAGDGIEWNACEVNVVDKETQDLIKAGVLSAMSVGIIVNEAEPVEEDDGLASQSGLPFFSGPIKILDYDLVEISFVDHPANYDAQVIDHPGKASVQNEHKAMVFKVMPTKDLGNLIPEDLGEKATGSSEVQSLLFDKEKFTEAEAKAWAGDHDFKHNKVDITENKIRLRQFDPSECEKDTFGTKSMADGVEAIFCVKQEKSLATPPPEKNRSELMKEKELEVPAVETIPEPTASETLPGVAKVEEPKEAPVVEKTAGDGEMYAMKMDACMGKMDELMAKIDKMMAQDEQEMSKEPEVKKELETPAPAPVATKEAAAEVTPTRDLPVEKTLEAMEKMVNLVSELGKKQDGMKDTIMAEVKSYIEELRAPAPGKASLSPTVPVEKKSRDEELRGMKPKELEEETKKVISQLFESLKQ